MKPCNFPGRKNTRRQGAYQMLEAGVERTEQQRKRLAELIVSDDVARASRSKKIRSGTAHLFR